MKTAIRVASKILAGGVMVFAFISSVEGNSLFGYQMFGLTKAVWKTDLIILDKVGAFFVGMIEMWFVAVLGVPAFIASHMKLTQHQLELMTSGYIIGFCLVCWLYEDTEPKKRTGVLPDMASLYSALGLKPLFPLKRFLINQGKCFYVGPFGDQFGQIYKDHLKPALERAGYSVFRADDIFSVSMIMEDIWESINTCELLVADITGKNANAFYEIGMAHAIGKKVILITQDIEDVPFDLRHYRIIPYTYTPQGCAALERALCETAKFEGRRLREELHLQAAEGG